MLAVVERSGLDEAFHDGCVAVTDTQGRLTAWFGDIDRAFYARSAAKPFQAAVCLEAGVELPPEHLAVACASHDGTPAHLAIVRRILADGGLDEADLGCPPDRPLSEEADRQWARDGHIEERRVFHDCSGKHALMLRACVTAGWDRTGYLDPDHPLQVRQLEGMRSVGALVDDTVGIDGCGTPVYRVSARGLAAAFVRLDTEPFAPVRTAMHRHPALVSGVGNADTEISVALEAVAKRGAEGLLAVAVAGHGALVVRCWDGSERAVAVAALSALDQVGWIGERSPLRESLGRPVRGGGATVGSVRPVFRLEYT